MSETQPQVIYLKDYKVPPWLVDETHLHVDINEDVTIVTSTLKLRRNPASTEKTKDLVLNGSHDLATESIALDGSDLSSNEYQIEDESLRILAAPDNCELKTRVAIKPQDNTALEGLYKSGDIFCTQCEAESFRNITWYLDRPDVMSRFTTTLEADKAAYPVLLSNGNDIDRGESGKRHWVTWQDPFPKPAYLFALVAGNLQHIEDAFVTASGRSVTLRIFTEAHNLGKLGHAMLSLKNAMRWDEEVYGREYDLDIFMIVAVDSFNMGAMENKGLNIFNTSCVLAHPDTTTDAGFQRVEAVVAHEYFHNWSGNRVTCRDWFQLSLKEGFTVFRDQQFSADMGSPVVCRVDQVTQLRKVQFPEDAGPMAHSIRPDSFIEINNFYTPTVYEKGAEVVRMVHGILGARNFRLGSDLYFDRHDGEAVTTEDFVKAMEDASGVDLEQFRLWYRQAGTPVLDLSGAWDEAQQTFTLKVEQSCPATPGQESKQPCLMPLAVGLLDDKGNDMKLDVDSASAVQVDQARHKEARQPEARQLETGHSVVLNLTGAREEFVFKGVKTKPVPSLLRGFSAPVRLNYDYSRDDLMFLMSHDSDGFNRWEASQRLGVAVIEDMVAWIEQGKAVEESRVDDRLMRAFDANLTQAIERHDDPALDKAMIAHMLELPDETWLANLAPVANVDAIHQARQATIAAIAEALSGVLLSVYRMNHSGGEYEVSAGEVARRSLRNQALAYLMYTDEGVQLGVEHYESATNMTDAVAALEALVGASTAAAEQAKAKALEHFYNRWADEPLVVDLWFNIQASCHLPDTLKRVKALMQHPAFDIKVPNRMRSLVAAFAMNNPVNFHHKSGEGYEFLADRVLELNAINPQMASRTLTPLTRWRKYDRGRQQLMKEQLARIQSAPDLSRDLFEVVDKSL